MSLNFYGAAAKTCCLHSLISPSLFLLYDLFGAFVTLPTKLLPLCLLSSLSSSMAYGWPPDPEIITLIEPGQVIERVRETWLR